MAISVNSKELIQLLELTPADQNIMLSGKHGIGKSEILTKYFASKGMKVVSLFLGQMSDPGDLIGLPYKNETTGKTEFMPPYWFPTDNQPIVLFLDELNRARPEVLQTIMDLALNKKLAGKQLPDGSRIISAVNAGEEYQLTDLDPALVSRFNIYNFKPTPSEWLLWAAENHVDERVINFIQEHSDMLDGVPVDIDNGLEKTPDRRGWKRVSDLITGVGNIDVIYKKLISGIVGNQAGALFFDFINKTSLPSAKDVLLNYKKFEKILKSLKLHELSIVNESLFRFMETGPIEAKDKEKVKKNLPLYLDMLEKDGKDEAFAHWTSLYSGGNYPNSMMMIVEEMPQLLGMIQEFVGRI
ncbi:MAG: AAA family ATPase [Bacteroidales bacterium]|nr:AAA family ATPase [Candidatus Scybalocola fimicaballi]